MGSHFRQLSQLDNVWFSVLKIILKSSWLRDALSELDPSCEKLTFIGNPPLAPDKTREGAKRRVPLTGPMLRIQATGVFGSTEVRVFSFNTNAVSEFFLEDGLS